MVADSRVEDIAARFDNIQAYDDVGPLVVTVEHGSAQNHSLVWKTDRLVQGYLTLCYDAKPYQDGVLSSSINTLGIYNDGLISIAASFIPIPAVKEPTNVDVNIEWDISQSPQKTRILSSFGEGNISQKATSLTTLSECVFMVGWINSFTPPTSTAEGGFRGIHWLGTLPDNLSSMTEFTSNMFPRLSAFFKDDSTSCQIFLRKVPRGLRATQVTGGTLIDYDEDTKEEHDWDIVRLFNSSMIATWAYLDLEDDGTSNDWFTKGYHHPIRISHLYTIYLPYRFGQRTPDYFRATLNGYFSSYFTNPFINYPLDKIPSDSWHGQSALAMRSCIYMIRMDAYTRRASVARNAGILRPIDEIVADISSRRLRGEKVQVKDWMKNLGD
ncbi:pdz dhr glgf [Trichoderma arundinaceum]|uniref:Pdz dhr glgf n=1 Tax=Trichoderma arundinaceum TaxID=490622 RepID=A0A395N7T1_TRIAR|nr:pdz dhr glgf [Trichoderma arundinaceum]